MADGAASYIIPSYPPGAGVVPASTINDAGAKNSREWQLASVAALGQTIPLVYGEAPVGAMYLDAFVHGATIYLPALWALGPCMGVQKITDSNGEAIKGVTMRHYDGSQTTPDARLKTAYEAAKKKPFNASLNGRAYSVFEIGAAADVDPSNYRATIKGLRVFDPRSSAWQWSDNAALCLADFISNDRYGWGKNIDWESVKDAAYYCDELVGGAFKRWTLNLAITDSQSTLQLVELLRAYAHCWVKRRGDTIRLVPDRPGPVDFALQPSQIVGKPKIIRRGVGSLPTVVCITYTDKTGAQEKDATAYQYMPGVKAGAVRWAESQVSMPGITSYQEAMREATERLLKLQHGDLEINADVRDIGIELEAGDLVRIPHPTFPEGKIYRLTANPAVIGPGKYKINGIEYQPESYCDDVALPPSSPNTTLPDPSNPPPVEELQVVERLTQIGGVWTSALYVTWARPEWAYRSEYVIEVSQGGAVLDLSTVPIESYVTAPVAEGKDYIIRVRTKTWTYLSDWTATSITARGKYLPPSDVQRFIEVLDVNGTAHLSWTAAHDIDAITYEVRRYIDPGVALSGADLSALWAAAVVVAVTADTRAAVALQPPGAWLYLVKALDSVGNYSLAPAVAALVVVLDDNTRFVDTWSMAITGKSNATAWTALADPVEKYTSDRGEPIGYGHASADDATGTFADLADVPFVLPHASGASELVSQLYDAGAFVGGTWSAKADITDHVGVAQLILELSGNMAEWEQTVGIGGSVSASCAARFARLRIVSAGSFTLNGPPSMTLVAIPRTESGNILVGSTGIYTARTAGRYKAYLGDAPITLEYLGDEDYYPGRDSITIDAAGIASFDVYLRNASGERVSGRVRWIFRGV